MNKYTHAVIRCRKNGETINISRGPQSYRIGQLPCLWRTVFLGKLNVVVRLVKLPEGSLWS
jgi:hypothetical protein